jgi:phosphoribosyl-dephospho-CoA transferase
LVVEGLLRLDAGGPVHLDGELALPDGGAVNWCELAQSVANLGDKVLVKTMDGIAVRTKADLFRTPVSVS